MKLFEVEELNKRSVYSEEITKITGLHLRPYACNYFRLMNTLSEQFDQYFTKNEYQFMMNLYAGCCLSPEYAFSVLANFEDTSETEYQISGLDKREFIRKIEVLDIAKQFALYDWIMRKWAAVK